MLIVPRSEASGQQATRSSRILLVDRQPLFLAALARLLGAPPLQADVDGCSDPAEAERLLVDREFDLVLAEAADHVDHLIGVATKLHIPVVLLGEAHEQPATAEALRAGAAGLFQKDSSPEEFLTGITAVLAGHRALGSSLLQELISEPNSPGGRPRVEGQLSPTEREILARLGEGRTVNEIAMARGVSQKTVRKHLANIYRKLHVRSRSEALLWAARMRLTPN